MIDSIAILYMYVVWIPALLNYVYKKENKYQVERRWSRCAFVFVADITFQSRFFPTIIRLKCVLPIAKLHKYP